MEDAGLEEEHNSFAAVEEDYANKPVLDCFS